MESSNISISKLINGEELTKNDYLSIIEDQSDQTLKTLNQHAVSIRKQHYGNKVFIRGLIEISNYCKNNCLYCGIRRENHKAKRYRIHEGEILECCMKGYRLGFMTFVLQGGEDAYYTDELLCRLIVQIKKKCPGCAVTLSLGERTYESYKQLKEAGADRYLLRHETADQEHYRLLHPFQMSPEDRKKALFQLKELGYQVGAGFMVGSPYQTNDHIAKDLLFLKELDPQMVGVGPFIPHNDTPFAGYKRGDIRLTLKLLSVIRIMLPRVLLPATTALGTADDEGREKGILAGANVVMPNLSPVSNRKKYELYNGKIYSDEEAAECIGSLEKRMESIGYQIVKERGDAKTQDAKTPL